MEFFYRMYFFSFILLLQGLLPQIWMIIFFLWMNGRGLVSSETVPLLLFRHFQFCLTYRIEQRKIWWSFSTMTSPTVSTIRLNIEIMMIWKNRCNNVLSILRSINWNIGNIKLFIVFVSHWTIKLANAKSKTS